MISLIVFPSDFFDGKKIDADLQHEYDAVINTRLFDTVIFNYDKWFNQGQLALTETPKGRRKAVYRGWMMKPEQYEAFYCALQDSNIDLVTNPTQYARFHVFPNIYKCFASDTARMMVFPQGNNISIDEVKRNFKRFMVKDYVKSVKGTDFPKYFDEIITQSEFDAHMKNFYKYRGSLFTGGICIKEFLDLKTYGGKTNEYRGDINAFCN